jgi:hypothetical protein
MKKVLRPYRRLLTFIAFDNQGWSHLDGVTAADIKPFHDLIAKEGVGDMVEVENSLLQCLLIGATFPSMLLGQIGGLSQLKDPGSSRSTRK